jgi:hypothetical protein
VSLAKQAVLFSSRLSFAQPALGTRLRRKEFPAGQPRGKQGLRGGTKSMLPDCLFHRKPAKFVSTTPRRDAAQQRMSVLFFQSPCCQTPKPLTSSEITSKALPPRTVVWMPETVWAVGKKKQVQQQKPGQVFIFALIRPVLSLFSRAWKRSYEDAPGRPPFNELDRHHRCASLPRALSLLASFASLVSHAQLWAMSWGFFVCFSGGFFWLCAFVSVSAPHALHVLK